MGWTTYDATWNVCSATSNSVNIFDSCRSALREMPIYSLSNTKADQCEYCGSRCDDSRGNCGACGAPRKQESWEDVNNRARSVDVAKLYWRTSPRKRGINGTGRC